MTREDTKERIAVMQAYVDGKDIEFYNGTNGQWETLSDVLWCSNTKYRVKPTPKYRPFRSAKECFDGMVKHGQFCWLQSSDRYVIARGCDNGGIYISSDEAVSFEAALRLYKFVDGTPFGVIEEESK